MTIAPSAPTEARALSLLSLDATPWLRDWAGWRVRFLYDNALAGTSQSEIAAFVRDAVAPLCRRRADCAGVVLYLLDDEDLAPVFRAFGGTSHGRGAIGAIQARQNHREAARMAALLAASPGEAAAGDAIAADLVALPDLHWQVSGFGQRRIARAEVRGHRVVVRMAPVNGQEMWLLDVDRETACARFRLRPDAMSKLGVAAALRACERRQARPVQPESVQP